MSCNGPFATIVIGSTVADLHLELILSLEGNDSVLRMRSHSLPIINWWEYCDGCANYFRPLRLQSRLGRRDPASFATDIVSGEKLKKVQSGRSY
jgi:hypothetical protein